MPSRPPVTTADYMVVAISPTLIFFLVGSLCFYLVEVFYQGQYEYRLLFVMAMFVMGIVALSRMAMEEGWAYAFLYAVGLAVVVAIALATFIKVQGPLAPFGPLINWGLMALIWWSAYKLVWDCTLMDEEQDSSGEGLLQSIGLDRMHGETSAPPVGQAASLPSSLEAVSELNETAQTTNSRSEESGIDSTPEARLWDWFRRLLEPDRRPHAPGKWVIYFSLAALPLFGLGQWFIPVENLGSRRFAFWMMAIYVASGLLLLLNTSFLGLRRYLRQRRLEMPLDMAGTWLSVGTLMVLALLIVVYILPSPSPEYSFAQLDIFKSKDHSASRYSPGGPDGAKKGESQQKTGDENAEKQGGDKSTDKGGQQSGDKSGQKGEAQNDKAQDAKSSQSGDKSAGEQKGKDGEKSEKGEKSEQKSDSENQPSKGKQQSGGKGGKGGSPSKAQGGKSEKQNQESQKQENSSQGKPPPSKPSSTFQPSKLIPRIPSSLGTILKWLFYVAIAIAAVYFAYVYRKELLAAWKKLLAELRELWERWFGVRPQAAALESAALAAPPRTFSSYADPFASGMAAQVPLPELVRYSFEALEAWGRDHVSPRATGQTPHEFAQQLGEVDNSVSREVRQLADLYCQIAYARSLPAGGIELLRGFWQRMAGTGRAA